MPHTLASQVTVVGAVHDGPAARMLEVILGHEPGASGVAFAPHAEVAPNRDGTVTVVVPSAQTGLVLAARDSGATVVSAGFTADADLMGVALDARSTGTAFTVRLDGAEHRVRLSLLGEHLADHALLAIAAAVATGVALGDAIAAIESLPHVAPRVMQPQQQPGRALVIDDSHDMTAGATVDALKSLAMFGTEGRRTVAVLGALDLPGPEAGEDPRVDAERRREAHDRIGRIIVRLNIARLIVIGDDARHIHNAAGLEGSWNGESMLVETPGEAYDQLREGLGGDDVVLVKFRAPDEQLDLVARLSNAGAAR